MNIFEFDVRTLLGMLFWGNLACLVLVYTYITCNKNAGDRQLAKMVILAKGLLAAGFLLTGYRGTLSDWLTVNVGNSLLVFGFGMEALVVLVLAGERRIKVFKATLGVAMMAIFALNLAFLASSNEFMRIFIGSVGVFAVLAIPSFRLICSRNSSHFKRVIGLFYLLYITILLVRGAYFLLTPDIDLFSSSPVQGISFTVLMLLTIFSLSAFLLLMKEEADEKLQRMAHNDFLTGLYNRQYFLDTAPIAFDRHKREKTICTVMFMDIDHFKRVNDTYGHAFGDEVIKKMAEALRVSVRRYDLPCRYGGEEFVVFVDNPAPDAGSAVAERIRDYIAKAEFTEQPDFSFTISIGVAVGVPMKDDIVDTFIDIADAALYEAKESGRNRVIERKVNDEA